MYYSIVHGMYMYNVHVQCTCTLYMYIVHVHCTCTFYMYIVHVHCTCTWYVHKPTQFNAFTTESENNIVTKCSPGEHCIFNKYTPLSINRIKLPFL